MKHLRVTFPTLVLVLLAAFGALGLGNCQPDREDASQDLIDAFAGGCSSRGFWTDSALSHTNALINVLTKIKTAGPCQALQANLTQIQSMNSQLQFLLQNENYSTYRYNEENIQELTLALKGSSLDPALQSSLESALADAQAQQTTLRSRSAVDGFNNAAAQMGAAMQTLVSQAGDMSYCFNETPAAALKLATNALAVGGSFISPVIGAAVSALGTLMNGAVEYARTHATNKALWELYSAKMPLALTCGLESMSNLYCQASDALKLIEFQKSNYPADSRPSTPAWVGMDIINRRLAVLARWLLQVKTGVSPNDSSEASKQILIWQKIQNIDNTDISVVGGLHGAIQLYDGATSDVDKQNIVLNTILGFAQGLAPTCAGCTGPLSGLSNNAQYFACWLVDGYRDVSKGDAKCPLYNAQSEPIEQYVRRALVGHADIKAFELNWKQIFDAAKSLADIEFSQTITLNPAELLRQAYAHDADNVSPHEVLIMLRDYIAMMLTTLDGSNPNDRPVLEQTLAIVNDSLAIIENRFAAEKTAVGRVRALIDKLDLKHSARAFLQLVDEIVSTDVQNRLDRGELPGGLKDLLRASGGDIKLRLQAAGVRDLGSLAADINSSRALTEKNITVFRDYFKPSFSRAIEQLYAAAHPKGRPGEPDVGVDRPNSQTLARLCFLLVSTGYDWPDRKSHEICRSQTLSSLYGDPKDPRDPLHVRIGELETRLQGKRLQQRYCAFHNYLRAERLAEVLNRSARPRREMAAFWEGSWTLGLIREGNVNHDFQGISR